jgi:1-acyl-sn-glycerol-3-phosphate acyltransferase
VELVYSSAIAAARLAFRALDLRIGLTGGEHVPTDGPVILASNHVSFLDFALVGFAAQPSGRRVRFLARHDVWRHPLLGAAMRAMRHVPVDRAAPAAAYLGARSHLREGEAVGIFPEAGVSTSYTVRSMMGGAVALARETGAPVLPMAIWGSQRVLTTGRPVDLTRGRPVSLLVGEPMTFGPGDEAGDGTRALGRRVQLLLDELQASPLHQPRPGEAAPWHPAHLGGCAPAPTAARIAESVPSSSFAPNWLPGGTDVSSLRAG